MRNFKINDLAKSCDPNETTLTLSLKEQISSKFASPFILSKIGITSIFEFSFFLRILSISFNCVLLSVKGKKIPENFSLATNSKSYYYLF